MNKKLNDLQNIYAENDGIVRRKGLTQSSSEPIYASYINLIKSQIDLSGKSVLDVGCGSGWSSFFISQAAKKVIGLDLHKLGYEPVTSPNLEFKTGSAEHLEFGDESFDVVSTNECLEHVPHPEVALSEFDRVLKRGGYVVISGPNLLSLFQSVRGLTSYVWKNRPLSTIFFRSSFLPKHPHGNTVPEIFYNLLKNIYFISQLYVLRRPLFKMREPDLTPPFHADNDACYYLNPLDLKYFLKLEGIMLLRIQRTERLFWQWFHPGQDLLLKSRLNFKAKELIIKSELSSRVWRRIF